LPCDGANKNKEVDCMKYVGLLLMLGAIVLVSARSMMPVPVIEPIEDPFYDPSLIASFNFASQGAIQYDLSQYSHNAFFDSEPLKFAQWSYTGDIDDIKIYSRSLPSGLCA
jgi:hypothetical protein